MKQQVWIFFLLAVPLCSSVHVHNAEVNGDVTLSPFGISTVKSVVWKFGINKVAEFDPSFSEKVKIFGNYDGRTTLDKETGQITISKLTRSDSGTFSVEVDSVLRPDSYRLEVFEDVKNVVIKRDDTDTDLCKLLCQAENFLNLEWSASHSEDIWKESFLTLKESDLSHSYTCTASNPLSLKSTTVKAEDICKKDPNPWIKVIAGILGSVGVIGAGVVGWFLYKSRDGNTDEDPAGNGSGPASNGGTREDLLGKSTV